MVGVRALKSHPGGTGCPGLGWGWSWRWSGQTNVAGLEADRKYRTWCPQRPATPPDLAVRQTGREEGWGARCGVQNTHTQDFSRIKEVINMFTERKEGPREVGGDLGRSLEGQSRD